MAETHCILSCPLKADSIRPLSLHKQPPHLVKRNKTITQKIGCNRRVFEMLGLSFAAKRFLDRLTDERRTERQLRRFQKQELSFGTRLKINTTRLVIPFMLRTFFGETFVEKDNQREALSPKRLRNESLTLADGSRIGYRSILRRTQHRFQPFLDLLLRGIARHFHQLALRPVEEVMIAHRSEK